VRGVAGRTAVVTGAGANIGRGIARHLAAGGVRVVAVDRDGDALEKLAGELHCETVRADFGVAEGEALGGQLVRRFGPIAFVVNNVGVTSRERYLNSTGKELHRVFATNFLTPWLMTRAVAADLVRRGQAGAVVWISSAHDHRRHGCPAYSTSKAAVAMLVVEMAAELGPHSIRVNAVSPGAITDGPRRDETAEKRIPLGRRSGTPEDVAEIVGVLLSEESRHVTGANWLVDGGLSTHS
jgi:NAD(P)-dependent dehydrogenase (short-subunit alcohol dehydrogenase family)